MKTNLYRSFLLTAIAATAAFAQSSTPIKVNVPFDFVAGGRTLQAGEYTVRTDITAGFTTIRSNASRKAMVVASRTAEETPAPEGAKLVFHRYGNEYFLAEVCGPDTARQIPESKQEKEMTAKVAAPATIEVAAIR